MGRPKEKIYFYRKLLLCCRNFLLCVICRSEENGLALEEFLSVYSLLLISVDYKEPNKDKELLVLIVRIAPRILPALVVCIREIDYHPNHIGNCRRREIEDPHSSREHLGRTSYEPFYS